MISFYNDSHFIGLLCVIMSQIEFDTQLDQGEGSDQMCPVLSVILPVTEVIANVRQL